MPKKKPTPESEEPIDPPEKRPRRRKGDSPLERKAWGYDPLLGLESIKTTMSGMLNDLFSRRGATDLPWEPLIDLYDDEDSLVIEMSLPGALKADIQMHAYQNLLVISGEIHAHEGIEESRYHFHERRRGPFQRSIPLPHSIHAERIKASLRDGTLKVVMPLEGKKKKKSVQVEIH